MLRHDLTFEGWVERVEGRKVVCKGRIVQGEAITCEAEGLFIQIRRVEITRLSPR